MDATIFQVVYFVLSVLLGISAATDGDPKRSRKCMILSLGFAIIVLSLSKY